MVNAAAGMVVLMTLILMYGSSDSLVSASSFAGDDLAMSGVMV